MENLLEHVFRNVLGVEQEDTPTNLEMLCRRLQAADDGGLAVPHCRHHASWSERLGEIGYARSDSRECRVTGTLAGSYATRQWIAEAAQVAASASSLKSDWR